MNSMNKVLKFIERYGDRLLRAHASAALMTPGRNPWTPSAISTRRQAEPDPARAKTLRTTRVQQDCTVSGQMTAASDPAGPALVKSRNAVQHSDN